MVGKIDDNCLSVVMVQLTQLLNEYDAAKEGVGEDSSNLLQSFLSSKRLEGCSERTLTYYETTINMMLNRVALPVVKIDTDNIRQYLSEYQSERGSSKVTIDNIRRIFTSFFSWLEDEEYILTSPVRRIHKVKFGRTVKDTFSDEELEKMRDGCENIRNLSIIDMLSSTGIRVGELVRLNRSDIDFNEREFIVFGKGESERKVYFDARTKLHLQEYLRQRSDDDPALFVTLHNPIRRISINGVETMLKSLEATLRLRTYILINSGGLWPPERSIKVCPLSKCRRSLAMSESILRFIMPW